MRGSARLCYRGLLAGRVEIRVGLELELELESGLRLGVGLRKEFTCFVYIFDFCLHIC